MEVLRLGKRALKAALVRLGYVCVPLPWNEDGAAGASEARHDRIAGDLLRSHWMRTVHACNATQIEELYRHFVFPGLPRNERRERLLNALVGTPVAEAIHVVHALHRAFDVEGDVCEFGVEQGATSALLANEMSGGGRLLWLFDSFEGLPAPTAEDELLNDVLNLGSIDRYRGAMAAPESSVLARLDEIGFPRASTRIKKGWVPATLREGELPSRIAFAYVDFDFYQPILDALEFIDPRMPVGGRIVVDDYGFFSAGAQRAVDRFVAAAAPRFQFEQPLPFAGTFCTLTKVS